MMLKLQKSLKKALNCENSVTENVAAAKIDVDDELHCPEIEFICFQCGIEYIPKNYM